jgi:hypothetical protein
VPRYEQPDEVSCGPTCLLQVYRHWGDDVPFERVDADVRKNPDGGTLAVWLALDALSRGYRARIHPFDLDVFDPTWATLEPAHLSARLRARAEAVEGGKLAASIRAYADFVDGGGRIAFDELTPALLMDVLDRGRPILTGLSATWLYRQAREREDGEPDDVAGDPVGHFVVVCGYAGGGATFSLRDPHESVPTDGCYEVSAARLINSVLLGASTYDADLLEIWPPARRDAPA